MHSRTIKRAAHYINKHDLKAFESSTVDIASPVDVAITCWVGQIDKPASRNKFEAIPAKP